ncbi:hypothetical protein BT69DRAFT_1284327 [Atractiella rhizophila]|nr:hypothetical protein BT69DRAFT_1284327 [Atractiella rhizophila]
MPLPSFPFHISCQRNLALPHLPSTCSASRLATDAMRSIEKPLALDDLIDGEGRNVAPRRAI